MTSVNTINGTPKEMAGSKSSANTGKATFAQKMAAQNRNEEEQKRAAQAPKAWTGVNPITQKPNTNGTTKQPQKYSAPALGLAKSLSDRHDWVWNVTVGAQCTVSTNASDTFTGILAGISKAKGGNQSQFHFNMVKNQAQEYIGQGADHAMAFSTADIALLEVSEGQAIPRTTNGAGKFRTDVDISGNNIRGERNLQRWEAPAGSLTDGALESGNDSGTWDQFSANEKLFGLKTDYDENIYTTTINRSGPQYQLREREAARLAREIESVGSTNAHVREERGIDDSGLDEETKYSGVVRDYEPLQSNQPGRYVPPSRRPPMSPNDTENLGDPSIISTARPKPDGKQEKALEEPVSDHKIEATASAQKSSVPEPIPGQEPKPSQEVPAAAPSATANVENDLLDSFKQFTAQEKRRLQEHKRNKASQDKAVKLNDLKKFSQMFKLLTPVPKDLLPILAKDEAKQKILVEKSQKNSETTKPSERVPAALIDPKSQRPLAAARWDVIGPGGDQTKAKGVPIPSGQMPKGPQAARPQPALGTRLAESHRVHKAMAGVPPQLALGSNVPRAPSGTQSPPKGASLRGPPSATGAKFNVKAMEFKPNPTVNTFKPGMSLASTAVGSPRSGSATRHASPANIPAKFFGDITAFEDGNGQIDPQASDEKSSEEPVTSNSGQIFPHRAFPTWLAPPQPTEETTEPEVDMEFSVSKYLTIQPPTNSTAAHNQAHQYQLPLHLQNGAHPVPHVHTPQPIPHAAHGNPYGQTHFDEHHMRASASQQSGYPASPRMQQTNMPFQSSMPPQAQMYPMQYVVPGQAPMGRQYSNGPHPMAPVPQGAHLAPMMVQNPSQNGYLPQQVAIPYGVVYTSPPAGFIPAQAPNGYPSPGRGAPMMMHSGSHQGHQPQFGPAGPYAQPVHSPQPYGNARGGFGSPQPAYAQQQYQQQQHHYPHQPRRTPSSGYGHAQQQQQVHHAVQQVQQINGNMEEDAK